MKKLLISLLFITSLEAKVFVFDNHHYDKPETDVTNILFKLTSVKEEVFNLSCNTVWRNLPQCYVETNVYFYHFIFDYKNISVIRSEWD